MVSKERMAILYQETDDKISKEKIFKEIYSKLEREAYELCHYYKDINFLIKIYFLKKHYRNLNFV